MTSTPKQGCLQVPQFDQGSSINPDISKVTFSDTSDITLTPRIHEPRQYRKLRSGNIYEKKAYIPKARRKSNKKRKAPEPPTPKYDTDATEVKTVALVHCDAEALHNDTAGTEPDSGRSAEDDTETSLLETTRL